MVLNTWNVARILLLEVVIFKNVAYWEGQNPSSPVKENDE